MTDTHINLPRPCAERILSARFTTIAVIVLVAAGLAVYANGLRGEMLFDDIPLIVNNPELVQAWPPWRAFSLHTFQSRPVFAFTLAINHAVGGTGPWGYHVVNIAIHLLASITLFGVIRRTLRLPRLAGRFAGAADWLALASALLWMVHPLQTQSVTYISQRCESLMGLFYLLTVYAVIRGAASDRPRAWYAAAVVTCLLGMGTKQTMVTAPAVVLLYDAVFLSGGLREAIRRRWPLYAGLACTWAMMLPYFLGRSLGAKPAMPGAAEYALTQLGVVARYLRLAFWPDNLCIDYAWPVAKGLADVMPGGAVVLALIALTVWAVLRRPAAGLAGAAFFIILSPTSSIAPIEDAAFEHRMYLSLAPLIVMLVAGAWSAAERLRNRLWPGERGRVVFGATLAAAALAATAALGWRAVVRNTDYHSPEGMWKSVVAACPWNSRAWVNVGQTHLKYGRHKEAIDCFTKAIALRPDYEIAYKERGRAYGEMGRFDEAFRDLERAIELWPTFPEARYYRAFIHHRRGRLDLALEDYACVIEVAPRRREPYLGRAYVYLAMGQPGKARADAETFERLGGEVPATLAEMLRRAAPGAK